MIAPNDFCTRCGEDLCNAQCPRCLDKTFCQRCDIREVAGYCESPECGMALCGEECHIVTTAGAVICDAHNLPFEEDDQDALYEERRDMVQR
jgi:hypothetical protein